MSIEIIISADEVRYITDRLRTRILRSDIENEENCLEDLETIEKIVKEMDNTITALTAKS